MQHRGQDSSGIASSDGNRLHVHTGSGLVSGVYDEPALDGLKGQLAIGHNRYSTSGGHDDSLNQPLIDHDMTFAFAHNGNLPYIDKLKKRAEALGLETDGKNDSSLMAMVLAAEIKTTGSLVAGLTNCWPLFTGAFSCVGLYQDQLFAFRDEHGIRPLGLGRTDHGFVIASETVAMDIIGADFVRDVKPGELVVIKAGQLRTHQIATGNEQLDAFEFVYLSRPDSRLCGQSLYSARYRAGQALAKLFPADADVVLSVPESGIPAATGYAHQSGIDFQYGILKNRYIARTFIEPEKIRRSSVELKFNLVVEIIAGKNIVLVDDSLVRGNTLKHLIKILKDYGAKAVHVRIASPPVKYPDYYGVDTPDHNDLLASTKSEPEICQLIGADSLAYLPLDDFIKSTNLPADRLCLSCFNGEYPIPVPYKSSINVRRLSK